MLGVAGMRHELTSKVLSVDGVMTFRFSGFAGWIVSCENFLAISDAAGWVDLAVNAATFRSTEMNDVMSDTLVDNYWYLPGRIKALNIFKMIFLFVHVLSRFVFADFPLELELD